MPSCNWVPAASDLQLHLCILLGKLQTGLRSAPPINTPRLRQHAAGQLHGCRRNAQPQQITYMPQEQFDRAAFDGYQPFPRQISFLRLSPLSCHRKDSAKQDLQRILCCFKGGLVVLSGRVRAETACRQKFRKRGWQRQRQHMTAWHCPHIPCLFHRFMTRHCSKQVALYSDAGHSVMSWLFAACRTVSKYVPARRQVDRHWARLERKAMLPEFEEPQHLCSRCVVPNSAKNR